MLDPLSAGVVGEVIVDGGRGADLLIIGLGDDRLYAGRDDVLRGRGGDDQGYDASPRQPLRSGDPSPFGFDEGVIALAYPGRGRDSFDGGAGRGDSVSYAERSASVRVDLATTAAIGGARGEHDSVKGVESVFGTPGDDRLSGNRRGNALGGGKATTASRAGQVMTASRVAAAAT